MLFTKSHVRVAVLSGLLLALGLVPLQAQERGNMLPRASPNAAVSQTIGITEVRIAYSRPSVRDRTIYGGLVPYDEVWRTGANEATTFSVSTPVQIEGQTLEAGTYGLFTIPGQDSWTIIFSEEPNQWGAFNYDSSQDALRVQVSPESADARELMTFTFEDVSSTSATCVLHWADTRVPFEISVNTNETIQARAEETDDWQALQQYAIYALQNDVMTDEALQWIDRSIEMNEQFSNLAIKARLLAAAGDYEQAVATGESALSLAESMDETPNGVEELQEQVSEWESEN